MLTSFGQALQLLLDLFHIFPDVSLAIRVPEEVGRMVSREDLDSP
jgi:hypothetical protein